jgi:hypothetical protein
LAAPKANSQWNNSGLLQFAALDCFLPEMSHERNHLSGRPHCGGFIHPVILGPALTVVEARRSGRGHEYNPAGRK